MADTNDQPGQCTTAQRGGREVDTEEVSADIRGDLATTTPFDAGQPRHRREGCRYHQ